MRQRMLPCPDPRCWRKRETGRDVNPSIDPPHMRRAPLAAALVALLFGCSLQADAATGDSAWQHLRVDPARRVFAQLPAPRSASDPGAAAATIPVTTCADDGSGSLRAAIAGAASGDTIDLAALACARITLQTGAITIAVDSLTLAGPGRGALVIDGNNLDRVFLHPYGGALTLHGLTIEHGRDRATGFDVAGGGCIASAGYLTLDQSSVRACYAGGEGAYGGAIYAYSLTMTNSTLSGNVGKGVHEDAGTAAFGGAAFVYAMQLVDSIVSGNRAEHQVHEGRTSYDIGGGIISVRGGSIVSSTIDANYSQGRAGGIATFSNISVSDSTFSGNIAHTEMAGGLFLRRPATALIGNSTITANHAATGGGALWLAVPAQLQSSILAGNSGGSGADDIEASAAITLAGTSNLIGAAGNQVTLPIDTLDADPRLGPLANNGGPTPTHALLAGSPALDTGNNLADLAFDQRGGAFARVHGAAPDIGAFEQQPTGSIVQAPVPALSYWMMALLAMLLAAVAAWRRQARTDRAG